MGFFMEGLDAESYDRTYDDRGLIERILKYFKPNRRAMGTIVAMVVLNSAMDSVLPVLISSTINQIDGADDVFGPRIWLLFVAILIAAGTFGFLALGGLVYPMLDDHTGAMGPRARKLAPHLGAFGWTREANRFGWHSFLGVEPGGRTAARFAVPARTTDLAGLPPAWIGVGGIDLFLDEDIEYAQRLNDAGVAAELIVVPGAFHGFDMAAGFDPTVRISGWFNTAKKNALRRALGLPVS